MNFENISQNENSNCFLEEKAISDAIQKIIKNYPFTESFKDDQDFINELKKIKEETIEKQKFITSSEFYKDGTKYKNQFRAEYNYRTGKFIIPKISSVSSEKARISKGEMISSLEWEADFYIDPTTCTDKNSKEIYKQFLLNWVEKKTLDLLDKYIIENEIQKNERRDTLKTLAYNGIKNRKEKKIEELSLGIIAEKTVKSFLARISLDHPCFEFEILPTNSYQDVEFKIDILIKRTGTDKEKGVQVGLLEDREKGDTSSRRIQFTINKNAQDLSLKRHQIEIRGGILLVEMPGEDIEKAFTEWKTKKYKEISTPDKYLNKEMQIELLKKILTGFIEIDDLDKKIKNAIL
jgi:hypothetical protein